VTYQINRSFTSFRLNLRPQSVFKVLSGVVIGLLLANVWSYFSLAESSIWAAQLDVNNEKNPSTFFSVLLLLGCAFLLWEISRRLPSSHPFVHHWRLLGLLFVGMAGDEWLLVHERVNEFLDDHFYTTGFLYYDWVIPGSLFVVLTVLLYARFLRSLPSKTRYHFLLAGGIYIAGALGMEMVSGHYIYYHGLDNRGPLALLNGVEEAAEMFGLIVFIYALLVYSRSLSKKARTAKAQKLKAQAAKAQKVYSSQKLS